MSDNMDTSGTSKARPSKKWRAFTDFCANHKTLDTLIRKKSYFDKSLFIKAVFENHQKLQIITAPRRQGKTTTLNLLKSFLEIECEVDGRPTGKPIEKTSNYEIFNTELFNGERLKIMKETDIVRNHFGQYPVIHLELQHCIPIASYHMAVEHCMDVLHKAYKQHAYLEKSQKLSVHEQNQCIQWCGGGGGDMTDIDESLIKIGLQNLCCYLFKHFDKKVIILCDEYDSVIMKALFYDPLYIKNVKDETDEKERELLQQRLEILHKVAALSIGILTAAVEGGTDYVERAVFTGISHISGVGIPDLNNIYSHTFLEKNSYFGLTRAEVEALCERYEDVNEFSFDELKDHYNGYTDKEGTCHIYSMWSVQLCMYDQRLLDYFWRTNIFGTLNVVFKIPSIRVKIQQLVQMKSTHIKVNPSISLNELEALNQEFLVPEMCETHEPDTFLNFMLKQGYLTYVKTTDDVQSKDHSGRVRVRLPNIDVQEDLLASLNCYYNIFCKLLEPLRNVCRKSFNLMFTNVENDGFKVAVKDVHQNLKKLLQQTRTQSEKTCLKVDEAALHTLICSIFFRCTGIEYCTDFHTDSGSLFDLAIIHHKSDCGAIFEFKHCTDDQSTSDDVGLDQINSTKNYDSGIFANKDLFPKPPSKIILIGLTIYDNNNLSMTCQMSDKKEKILCFRQSEPGRKRKRRKVNPPAGAPAAKSRKFSFFAYN